MGDADRLRAFTALPSPQTRRLIDFDQADIDVLETFPPQYVLRVRGTAPYPTMHVEISPLIYLRTLDQYTTTVGLAFFQGQFVGKWPEMMAGAIVSLVPMITLFVIAQQYFVRGIAISGLKG